MPFGSTPFTRAHLATLKNAIRDRYPEIKSSHVDEATAFGFGFDTYAAMLPILEKAEAMSNMSVHINSDWFALRLLQLGYDPLRFAELRQMLWTSVQETRPAASQRQEASSVLFKPRPANDT